MEFILKQRNVIVQQKGLTVLSVFDTFKKTSGKKDVSLCRNKGGQKIILRIGEVRPREFFPKGFAGKHLRIPKIFERHSGNTPYELEEYFAGPYVGGLDRVSQRQGRISDKLLDRLVLAFWEWQEIGKRISLVKKYKTEKLQNFFNKGKRIIKNSDTIYKIIINNKSFWESKYPAKWKYSLDNLIMTPDQKIGFIDNAGVGLRYFGYDLGWLIWPQWFSMDAVYYSAFDGYLNYLECFLEKLTKTAPGDFTRRLNLERYFWLVIFERLVGALFDVVNQTSHLIHWGMGLDDPPKRREEHVNFLNKLLKTATEKLEHS